MHIAQGFFFILFLLVTFAQYVNFLYTILAAVWWCADRGALVPVIGRGAAWYPSRWQAAPVLP